MKPKAQTEHDEGLLEYLEDIIGTAHYKAQIEELNVQVELITEQRATKLTRVRVVEKERNAMQGQKNEAESFLVAENQLVVKKNQVLQVCVFEVRRHLNVLNDSIVIEMKLISIFIDLGYDETRICIGKRWFKVFGKRSCCTEIQISTH